MKTTNRKTIFEDIGLVDYQAAWDYQSLRFDEIVSLKEAARKNPKQDQTPNYLLFCEHPHVYTIGKSGKESNLLINEDLLKSKGATLYRINRGGDITYHGPGQIVAYPILDLDNFGLSIKSYIDKLEEVIIRTLACYGLEASRSEGATGVWLDVANPLKARKIAAIGVRTSHWVSMHGFAFNINTDLNYFDFIVPCGIRGKEVTSLQRELGKEVAISEVKALILEQFEQVFEMQFV